MTDLRNHREQALGPAKSEQTSDRHALLISIQSRFANAIFDGTKTVELRRRPPRHDPDLAIIYSSGLDRRVLGIATLKQIHTSTPHDIWERFGSRTGVTRSEFSEYFDGSCSASALELARPERGTNELPLQWLRALGFEPPQSWRYMDEVSAARIVQALDIASAPWAARADATQPPKWLNAVADVLTSCAHQGLAHGVAATTLVTDVARQHRFAPKFISGSAIVGSES